MKNMKASVALVESSPYTAVYEDPRTSFKHQSLMQDYEQLQKEAEAIKKRFQKAKQKKSTLMAEVRFLRRRHKYLMQNQSSSSYTPQGRSFVQPQNSEIRNKTILKEKKITGAKPGTRATMPPPVPRFDLNRKGLAKESTLGIRPSTPVLDLNKTTIRVYNGNTEASLRNSKLLPDLNQTERNQNEMESNIPIFDLNQISREEEELQANGEPTTMMVEETMSRNSIRSGNDELDMKLSALRKISNGSNRAGKRKITWQDQVALRV